MEMLKSNESPTRALPHIAKSYRRQVRVCLMFDVQLFRQHSREYTLLYIIIDYARLVQLTFWQIRCTERERIIICLVKDEQSRSISKSYLCV